METVARAKKPSGWVTWRQRESLPELVEPGIYFIGRFRRPPSAFEPTHPSILYIGHTIQPLKNRLMDFHHSAFEAKSGHSGGGTFNRKYLDGKAGDIPRGLRVCVIPVSGEKPVRSALILYLERKYIYGYVRTHGRLPACNSE